MQGIFRRNFTLVVSPDGELEFKKISLVDSTIDSGPYQSCDSDSEDSGDSKLSGD